MAAEHFASSAFCFNSKVLLLLVVTRASAKNRSSKSNSKGWDGSTKNPETCLSRIVVFFKLFDKSNVSCFEWIKFTSKDNRATTPNYHQGRARLLFSTRFAVTKEHLKDTCESCRRIRSNVTTVAGCEFKCTSGHSSAGRHRVTQRKHSAVEMWCLVLVFRLSKVTSASRRRCF